MSRRPLTILASIDPVLRDSTIFGMVTDAPGTVVLRHDILDAESALRRVVLDSSGVVEDVVVPLEHACLSCAVREDALPVLRKLSTSGWWERLVLALPVSAETLPVTRTLSWSLRRGGALDRVRLAAVVGVVDVTACEHDLLADDLLAERGLALGEDDRRAVGEALVAQVGHADIVVVAGDGAEAPVGSDLLDHLRGRGSVRIDGLHQLDTETLFARQHHVAVGERRTDPHRVHVAAGPAEHGVWSIELASQRPFHPERLVERVEELGSGRLVSRGVFWVPTRPDSACVWDGSGGQLSIGDLGPWGTRAPRTRLVYTGTGDEAGRLRTAFDATLLSDREMAAGLGAWLGREDVLAPWLGDRSAT